MISNHASAVHAFYFAYYGRPADPDGLDFWSAQLDRAGGDIGAIAGIFAASPEAAVRFDGHGTAERITGVYQQLFNREPDAAGLRFWQEAVDSGRTTLADVALNILHGAQGSDVAIVALRLQAAQAFTAAVAGGAADYAGYASVEAARALVAAVDAEATPDGIAALVRLAASLSDSAHDAPLLLDTLGVQGQLAPLFQLAAGRAEPGKLLELLTGLAAIAAEAPASLDALLKGDGVAGLLGALPRGVNLADLVSSLEQGGLRALTSLVSARPPQPEPEPEPEPPGVGFTFENGVLTVTGAAVSQVLVDLSKGTIAWDDEEFTLGGAPLTQVVVTAYAGTVSLSGAVAELAAVLPQSAGVGYQVVDVKAGLFTGDPGARVLAADAALLLAAADKVTIAGTLSLEESNLLQGLPGFDPARLDADIDLLAPDAGQLRFDGLPPVGEGASQLLTNRDSFTLTVEGAEAGSTIRYQVADGAGGWTDLPDPAQAGLDDGSHVYRALVIDAAGNIGYTDPFTVTIDTAPPTIRTIGFGANDGLLARGERVELAVSFDAAVTVAAGTVLQLNNGGAALYQSGSGSGTLVFIYTPAINQSVALLALAPQAALEGSILDRAGNALPPSAFDGLAPAAAPRVDADKPGLLGLRLASDTGSSAVDGITSNGLFVVSGLETAPGTSWQYKLDPDADWREGGQIDADGRASVVVSGDGVRTLTVRQFDLAGNDGPILSTTFTLDTQPPVVSFDKVEGATGLPHATPLATADVVFRYQGELRANDQVFMQIDSGPFVQVPLGAINVAQRTVTLRDVDVAADPTITVQVIDVAGNVSEPVGIDIDGMHGAPALAAKPTAAGLEVTSALNGTLFLRTDAGLAQLSTTGGIQAGRTFVIGAQADEQRGEVVLRTLSSDEYTAPGGEYVFGSAAGEQLSASAAGGHLWGFGGNDTLLGGAGNDWLYAGAGTNTLTGGRGADRIDLTEGGNTVHFSAGDSNNGVFDTLVFDGRPGGNMLEQWLSFDVSVSQVRSGTHFPNPADDSPQALMDAINAGYTGSVANPVRGALITTFHNGETWLAVDTGNAIIDGNDYLIELVGTVPDFEMVSNGDIWLRVTPQ